MTHKDFSEIHDTAPMTSARSSEIARDMKANPEKYHDALRDRPWP